MELLIVVVTWAILEEELAKAAVAEVPSDQLEVLLERCKLKEKRSIFIKKFVLNFTYLSFVNFLPCSYPNCCRYHI